MFWIVCDPSSGSIEVYLTEIICRGSLMFDVCLLGVGSVILNPWCVCVCVYGTTNISEPLRIISVKYSSILPDDGSHTIRNMLE